MKPLSTPFSEHDAPTDERPAEKSPVVVGETALRTWLGAKPEGKEHAARIALLDLLLDAIEANVFVVDETGVIVMVNRRGASLLEQEGEALLSFIHIGTSDPGDAGLGAWSRGALRAWRRRFVTSEGSTYAFVVIDSEEERVEGALAAAARSWSLTTRQIAVLRLVLAGQSTKQIAASLGAAPKTIDVHLGALFEKVGVASRAALVSKVWKLERPGRIGP